MITIIPLGGYDTFQLFYSISDFKKQIKKFPILHVTVFTDQTKLFFSESFSKGIDKGASFAAYYKGLPVVNLWGGIADEQVKRPWKEKTMGFMFSTTKFAAAITVAHLVERQSLLPPYSSL